MFSKGANGVVKLASILLGGTSLSTHTERETKNSHSYNYIISYSRTLIRNKRFDVLLQQMM